MPVITLDLGLSLGHPGAVGGITNFDWYAAGTSDLVTAFHSVIYS